MHYTRFSILPANASKINKHAIGRNAKDVNRLLLNGQDGEGRTVQVNTLIVRQVDLVTAETSPVGDMASGDADNVKRAVFERRPRIRTNRLVVTVDVVKQRSCVLLVGNIRRRPNNYVPTYVVTTKSHR